MLCTFICDDLRLICLICVRYLHIRTKTLPHTGQSRCPVLVLGCIGTSKRNLNNSTYYTIHMHTSQTVRVYTTLGMGMGTYMWERRHILQRRIVVN